MKTFIQYVIFFHLVQNFHCIFNPCPFNEKCDCQYYNDGEDLDVTCKDCQEFPTFSAYNGTVADFNIYGNFTHIPAYAFYSFQNVQYPNAIFTNKGYIYADLTVDDNAFVLYDKVEQGYESIYFYTYRNLTIPKVALSKVIVNVLQFYNCEYETVKNDSFQGVQSAGISFIYSNVQNIENGAFNGLIIPPSAYVTLDFQGNFLKDIPYAVRNFPGLQFLYLQANTLKSLGDNAFCYSLNCPALLYINLQLNLINSTTDKTFTNLSNLAVLNLAYNLFIETPTNTLQSVASTLRELYLDSNLISTITANSFYKFTTLNVLTLDNNPINEIQPGAFNGADAILVLNFTNLANLNFVDLLVTNGMASIQKLQISHCPVNNVSLSDPSKMPATLHWVIVSNGTDVQRLDPNIESWLVSNSVNIVDISNNRNFDCDSSIQWMAKYVLCAGNMQILATATTCANTKQSLSAYLQSFEPSC